MKRRRAFQILAAAAATVPARGLAAAGIHVQRSLTSRARPLMGTRFEIFIDESDKHLVAKAHDAAFQRAEKIAAVCSDYPGGELHALSRKPHGKPHRVSPDLFQALASAKRIAATTGGLVDPTIGPLTRLWRESRRSRKLPDPTRLETARAATGHQHLQLDPETSTVTLKIPGMRLDLGAFAKGAAADEMLAVLATHRCPRACVVAGGDIRLGLAPRGLDGWPVKLRVADDLPIPRLTLAETAVSTSGDLSQSVEIADTRYSHIIDLRTGLGFTRFAAASVIADTGSLSDPLATAACLAGPKQATASILAWGARSARLITKPASTYQTHLTPDFPS
jgi:thiamine biosynthesis lipoprotein